MKKNIVLVGMMGSGKSVIAKALAERLQLPCYSTDELIEQKTKKSIKALVASKGWEYFRSKEEQIVAQLAKKKGVIIDTGGGVILNPDNVRLLKKHGIIFFIKVGPAVIFERIKDDKKRPLINVPNPLAEIRRIYKQRLPLYNQADVIVNASVSIESAVAAIARKVVS